MATGRTYKCLEQQVYTDGNYAIVPVRDEDKYKIMQWRNEQMYHLRQTELLTKERQEAYFKNVVSKLFEQEQPGQILFSYLENEECIGYGGLVHIDWQKQSAEVSFIMATELEKSYFEKHWSQFLKLLFQVAFDELKLLKIFTYAYDLRPHLYLVLEQNGFKFSKKLPDKIQIDKQPVDVLIHEKFNPDIKLRKAISKDMMLLYQWANDPQVREQSFNMDKIPLETHQKWFENKLNDCDALLFIAEINEQPIGLLRFDMEDNHAVIGISLDKTFRGKGLSAHLLNLATDKYFEKHSKPVYAYIKKKNLASIQAFKKAGFDYKKEVIMNGFESVLYIKKI